ncbi:MAG: hypothetical protein SFV20_07710 [Sphingopyxis sp.]|nr:hypothetical protein [Sphingopyxis sp.]
MGWIVDLLGDLLLHATINEAAERNRWVRWFFYALFALMLGVFLGWLAAEYF